MLNLFKKIFISTLILISLESSASSISKDAEDRGINDKCHKYLTEVENAYQLSGLNMTFVHPENNENLPSLHVSSQIYNNGSSTFSATLVPDKENCYLSTVMVTAINNQSCSQIAQIKSKNDQNLQTSNYADGKFIVITPKDDTYQTILSSSGENSCTITESRMMWPGR